MCCRHGKWMKVGGRRREEDREVDANSGYNLTIVTVKGLRSICPEDIKPHPEPFFTQNGGSYRA
jgi:hypothetical protein